MAIVALILIAVYVLVSFLATYWVAWPWAETLADALLSRGRLPAPVRFCIMWASVALLPLSIALAMLRERLGKRD